MNSWHKVEKRIGFDGFGRIDPYIDWAFGTLRMPRDVPSEKLRFPVLLRLTDGLGASDFASGSFFEGGAPADWPSRVFVPEVNLVKSQGGLSYFTALVTENFFDYFDDKGLGGSLSEALMGAIARMAVSRPVRRLALSPSMSERGGDHDRALLPEPQPQFRVVVTGIIDDGLAIANARFRTADRGTRVEAIWLQDGKFNAAAARYGFGRVLSKHGPDGIDAALQGCMHAGNVDEDAVYARLGLTEFEETGDPIVRTVALQASHGAHVMDLACGRLCRPGDESGELAEQPIVCVQLPAASEEGTSGASLDTHVIDGIRFILEQSDAIARRHGFAAAPVVINISFGTLAGRHDGTSDLELAIDELIQARPVDAPLRVIIPAGNGRLSRCHAALSFPSITGNDHARRTLAWRVLPDDRTTSHLEIWLPPGDAAGGRRLSIEVTPPDGTTSPPCFEEPAVIQVFGASDMAAQCDVRYCHMPLPTARGMFLVTLRPTALDDDGDPASITAMPGVWTVRLNNLALAADEIVHAWIQRDDTRYGHPVFGRQSHFEVESDQPFESLGDLLDPPESEGVSLLGTLNGIATGRHTIVIGGFRLADFGVATYSGAGPVLSREGPDALAPSDRSRIRRGLLASGTRSGSVAALSGTSVAAPLVARILVDRLSRGESADSAAVAAIATSQETAEPGTRPQRPDSYRGGAGRIVVDFGWASTDDFD